MSAFAEERSLASLAALNSLRLSVARSRSTMSDPSDLLAAMNLLFENSSYVFSISWAQSLSSVALLSRASCRWHCPMPKLHADMTERSYVWFSCNILLNISMALLLDSLAIFAASIRLVYPLCSNMSIRVGNDRIRRMFAQKKFYSGWRLVGMYLFNKASKWPKSPMRAITLSMRRKNSSWCSIHRCTSSSMHSFSAD